MLAQTILWGLIPAAAVVFLILCLAVSAIGFYRLVYFISIGYGFSIAAMALASLALGLGSAGLIPWVQALLLAAYGLRLGIYLVARERDAGYRASLAGDERSSEAGLAVKLAIWISVACLYVMQFMPALARFAADASGVVDGAPAVSAIGLAIMAAGLAIEWVADAQKNAAKRRAPGRFCDSGLFRISRCPNYFGEILVWTGNLVAGAAVLGNALAWALSGLGYACIILIMIGSARRLEIKQEERYGAESEYRRYAAAVPILLPLVPVYSLKKAKIYLG
jgi:steroid 5-alpha reductase family enzyme